MDIQLSQTEADQLIGMLKECLVDIINVPSPGKAMQFEMLSQDKQHRFIGNIFRGRINRGKMNYSARIKANGVVLLELHINPSNIHMNPDGERIEGSHWHLYREGYGHKYAFPADDVRDKDFVNSTILFLKKFQVVEIPSITEQIEFDFNGGERP